MLFDGWQDLWRMLAKGVLGYVALVAILRVSGKRTLAKFNAFDFVVTIALGSTLATIVLSQEVALVEGAGALGVLVGLQYLVAQAVRRWQPAEELTKATPSVLLEGGRILEDQLTHTRVTRGEVLSAVRAAGYGDLDDIAMVVLETDGSLSVIPQAQRGDSSALDGLQGRERRV